MRNPFSKIKTKAFEVRNQFEKKSIPIIDIGAIAVSGVLNERMIPTIMADFSERPDLRELIRIHEHSHAGDMRMQWGMSGQKGEIRLILEFIRPIETLAIFDFNIRKFGAAVDAIFRQRALYLQEGVIGIRLSQSPSVPKVFCEIPSTGVEAHWEKMYSRAVFEGFREAGLTRADAKIAARRFLERTRGFDKEVARSLGNAR